MQPHFAADLLKAVSIFRQILLADPNQLIALHLIGVISHQIGKNDCAVDLVTKALPQAQISRSAQ